MKLLDTLLVLVVLVALAFWSLKMFVAIFGLATGLGLFILWNLSHVSEVDWEDL